MSQSSLCSRAPSGQTSRHQIEIWTFFLLHYEARTLSFLIKTPWKLPLILFLIKLVPSGTHCAGQAAATISWYAFECGARRSTQVGAAQAFAATPRCLLCYITQALQGRIGHGNETERKSRAGLCARLRSLHFQSTHTHTYACTKSLSENYFSCSPHRQVWFLWSIFLWTQCFHTKTLFFKNTLNQNLFLKVFLTYVRLVCHTHFLDLSFFFFCCLVW